MKYSTLPNAYQLILQKQMCIPKSMCNGDIVSWVSDSRLRIAIMQRFIQPLTPRQLAQATSSTLDQCSEQLRVFESNGLATCLNKHARKSRLYWLTRKGQQVQKRLRLEQGLKPIKYEFPQVNWDLYGWVLFTHRQAIIKALTRPMQPPEIKRKAVFSNPDLRVSANNIRDIMPLLLAKGIIVPVRYRRKKHLKYELTEIGQQLRGLIRNAEQLSYL